MKDLGITRKELYGGESFCEPSSDYDSKIVYPTICMEPAQASAAGLSGASFGEEMEMTVRVRVASISESDKAGPRITLDVISMEHEEAESGLQARYKKAMK